MRLTELTVQEVEHITELEAPGILYVSRRFKSAIHLCPCEKCRDKQEKVVTPFGIGDRGWEITGEPGNVTLRPSISNPWCGAHYYITNNKIDWL